MRKNLVKNILQIAIKSTCNTNAYMLSLVYKIKRKTKWGNFKMSDLTRKNGKKGKKQQGITLIALVVTIIVLIILAGVSINMLVGENGIITKAQFAKTETEETQAREKLEMALLDLQLQKQTNPEYNAEQFVTDYLTNQGMVVQDDVVIVDDYQFMIDKENLGITQSLGKGTESQTIEITLNTNLASDYTKATLSIEIQGSDNISKIQINGSEVSVPEKTENKYTIMQDVTTNGNYNVYVLDNEEEYKIAQIQVTGISEDMQISTKEELESFRDRVNMGATYEGRTITLQNDIDLQGNADNQWVPIAKNEDLVFRGTFNGNNHIIKNLYIDTTEAHQGIFGVVQRATIENLTVTGNIKNTGQDSAAIVAVMLSTTVRNCHNKVSITSQNGYQIAGISAYCDMESYIINSSNEANITVLGYTEGSTNESFAGGIVGNCSGYIENCYNTGNISGYSLAGGIAGGILQGEIKDCYNIGNISVNSSKAGGISGYIHYYSQGTVGYTKINNTYSTGIVTGNSEIGASIGTVTKEESILQADNNYALTQNDLPAIGGNITNANVKAELKTSEELKQLANTLGEAFKEDTENINNGYPILQWQ